MDGRQEKIEIPKVIYEGDDKKLKERIGKFKVGTLRIAIFTIVGLIMGANSYRYVYDDFIITKVITAVPYKIAETIYVFLLGTDGQEWVHRERVYGWITEFFPHSMLATWMAETMTTALIGAAIYGSLAYFTGDKRVFTLQRFLKFAGCWCGVILAVIAASYAVNAKAMADNEAFRGDARFYLYAEKGGGYSVGRGEANERMREYFFCELEPVEIVRDREKEIELGIYYNDYRFGLYLVNNEACYVATEAGRTYRISEEFAEIVGTYARTKQLPEISGVEDVSGGADREEVSSEEKADE